ncbi:HAD family hydrolase [Streptomyces sp. NPDC093591]|uniref:HAD family hydrolase n=1 Tax=Streptomyces sp. NPDC093591 TaxID=3366044 RepID=UPI003816C431
MTNTPTTPPTVPPKLVATDLDGTLLRSDGTLSQRTRAALAAAERAGIPVVLVTGRPPRSVPALLRHIGPHTAIAANGAAVHSPDGTIARTSPIRLHTALRLAQRMRAAIPGVAFALEFDRAFGHEAAYPDWSFDDEAVELVGSAEEILAHAAPGGPLLKMLAHHPALPLDAFYEQARHIAGRDAETTHSTSTVPHSATSSSAAPIRPTGARSAWRSPGAARRRSAGSIAESPSAWRAPCRTCPRPSARASTTPSRSSQQTHRPSSSPEPARRKHGRTDPLPTVLDAAPLEGLLLSHQLTAA